MDERAVVLGGGGVTGIAWETGVLLGLAEAGVDLSAADRFVGTSAGSVVAAQVTQGGTLQELYERQLAMPVPGSRNARLAPSGVFATLAQLLRRGDRRRARARLARKALTAKTAANEMERLAQIENRLPSRKWPRGTELLIPAVDAETGEEVVFDRDSGAELTEAVAASCALPLVWPPMTIHGRRYVDGGLLSPANVHLAAGCGRVVVLAPVAAAPHRDQRPGAQARALGAAVRTVVISPDRGARKAIGGDPLDPARRGLAAEAGRRQ
ncbi:patatin-like phospholipase family protein, partial [Streptomyces sp. A7024]